jgi:hypothetical protein
VLELAASREWRVASSSIAVNLSAANLHDVELPKFVADLLEAEDLPPDVQLRDHRARPCRLGARSRSCSCAASVRASPSTTSAQVLVVRMRQQLSVDEIKVTCRSSLGWSTIDGATIVRTTIALGPACGSVVAESVETSEALVMLRDGLRSRRVTGSVARFPGPRRSNGCAATVAHAVADKWFSPAR